MAREAAYRKYQLTINNPLEHGFSHEVIKQILGEFKSFIYGCLGDEIGAQPDGRRDRRGSCRRGGEPEVKERVTAAKGFRLYESEAFSPFRQQKREPCRLSLFVSLCRLYFLLSCSSMLLAPSLPAPMARITVAAPVTASPPA